MLKFAFEVRARALRTVSVATLLTAMVAPAAGLAQNQSDPDEPSTEKSEQAIIVTGTRREGVTYLESARPVDIVSADVLNRQGSSNLNDALRVAVPSLNVQQFVAQDGSAFIRPFSLRGCRPIRRWSCSTTNAAIVRLWCRLPTSLSRQGRKVPTFRAFQPLPSRALKFCATGQLPNTARTLSPG